MEKLLYLIMFIILTVDDDIIVPVRQFTTPMTSPTNPPAVSASGDELSTGAIAGIVVGIVISIIIVIVIIVAIRFVIFV